MAQVYRPPGQAGDKSRILVDRSRWSHDSRGMTPAIIEPDIVVILKGWAADASAKDASILTTAAREIESLRARIRAQNCKNHPGKPAQVNGLCWACIKQGQRARGRA